MRNGLPPQPLKGDKNMYAISRENQEPKRKEMVSTSVAKQTSGEKERRAKGCKLSLTICGGYNQAARFGDNR